MVSATLLSVSGELILTSFQVSKDSPLKIIIVGAGLSGIGAAISCALAGHGVVVLESVKELAEV
jgi:salicylate hydroxylase